MRRDGWVRLGEFLGKCFLFGAFDYRVEGLGNVPQSGGLILASTHASHLDPIVVRAPMARHAGFVARKTLFANPVFGGIIARLGAVELDRDATTPAGLREVLALLRKGAALILFPEGTRSRDGEIGPLRPGVALLARKSGVPVVPVAVDGTYQCWPRTRKWFRPGRIRVVFGEPVSYDPPFGRKEILADLDGRLRALRARARMLA